MNFDNNYLISFQTSAYDYISFADEISFAINHRVPAFEVFFDGWLPDAITAHEWDLLETAASNGMKFSVHAPLRDYLTERDIDEVKPVAEFCGKIGARLMTVHFDRLAPDMIGYLLSALPRNVKLSIENTIPDENAVTKQCYLEYMSAAAAGYDIYATLDIGHAVVNSYDPIDFVRDSLRRGIHTDCFHIHNNDGQHDLHHDLTDGVIDYERVLTFIFENGMYAHFVTEHWGGNVKSAQFFMQILQKWEKSKKELQN